MHMAALPDAVLGIETGGSLPTPATSSGSASPLRRPCRNCKVASDIRKRCRAHGIGNSVHMHTDV